MPGPSITDADDDELEEDELPEWKREPPKVDLSNLNTNDPESMLKFTKKGRTLMMFASVSGSPTERETERITQIWQGSLFNANIETQRSYKMDQTTVELKFREASFQKYSQCEKHILPRNVYYQTITDLRLAADLQTKKSRHQYYLLSKYELLQCGDIEKQNKKRQSPEERPVYYATIEDTYDIIQKAHISTGQGGRDRMLKHLKEKYANITKESLELFKSYCLVCQEKRKRPKTKGVVVKPILSSEFNSRAQVDLIDMQSLPQGQFKWIMVYQCHLTKFVSCS